LGNSVKHWGEGGGGQLIINAVVYEEKFRFKNLKDNTILEIEKDRLLLEIKRFSLRPLYNAADEILSDSITKYS
jgi:hypothetical protein